MGATLEQVLFTLIRRIRRNYLLVRTLAALTFFLYVALVVLTLAFFQWPAAAITVGMTLTTLALVRWRRSLLYLPSETEAARILDECLASKNRAAAYLDLKRSDEDLKSEPLRSEKCALLEKQLSARLSGFDLEAAAPFKIPLILQRLLYTLPLVIVALLFLIFHLLPADRNAPNLIEAEKIAHLIQTNPLLPEGLKQELRTLASALSSHALSSSEVSKALERAQAELAESQRQLS
ncbi:MAG: hypothetical protein GX589_08695, partial [Deltaproteobacteria bacterium]|nr:hypothetical protein [Deltaproteobacteria bacterium]